MANFYAVVITAVVAGALGGCAVVEGLGQYSKEDCSQGCDGGGPDAARDDAGPGRDGPSNDASLDEGPADGPTGDALDGADGSDAGPTGDAGCGPLNRVDQCGACGVACNMTTGTPSCTGATCTYACLAGRSDCNSASPDTDGCECATPGCCGAGCQTSHVDGVGQPYFDCNPPSTYTEATAFSACAAYAVSVGSTAAKCVGPLTCSGSSVPTVCFTSSGQTCANYCWQYTGIYKDGGPGTVWDCACPANRVGSWN